MNCKKKQKIDPLGLKIELPQNDKATKRFGRNEGQSAQL